MEQKYANDCTIMPTQRFSLIMHSILSMWFCRGGLITRTGRAQFRLHNSQEMQAECDTSLMSMVLEISISNCKLRATHFM